MEVEMKELRYQKFKAENVPDFVFKMRLGNERFSHGRAINTV